MSRRQSGARQAPGNLEKKMKTTRGSESSEKKVSRSGKSEVATDGAVAAQGVDRAQLDEMIAVAAYFRAEQRGFAPGDELADWFDAEAEYLYRSDTAGTAS
jgi:hypothetical protein